MAQKQTKKTTAAKGRKKAAPKKAQQEPIRREVGAGVCLLLTVLGFNFVGDGLRDAFDPKMKR